MTTVLQNLEAEIGKNNYEVKTIVFPIRHTKNGIFEDKNGFQFTLSIHAVDGFRKLTRFKYQDENGKTKYDYHYSFGDLIEAHNNYDWNVFERCANHPTAIERVNKKDGMIATLVNGQLVGLFKNYTFIEHNSITSMLRSHGLLNRVNYSLLTTDEMKVGLRIAEKIEGEEKEELQYNLIVSNNISGWRTIEFFVRFKFGEREFDYKFESGSKRHLSKVGELIEQLKETLDTISKFNFRKTLKDTDGGEWLLNIEKQFLNEQKYNSFVLQLIEFTNKIPKGKYTGYDLMGIIMNLGSTHGNKLISETIVKWYVKQLFKM